MLGVQPHGHIWGPRQHRDFSRPHTSTLGHHPALPKRRSTGRAPRPDCKWAPSEGWQRAGRGAGSLDARAPGYGDGQSCRGAEPGRAMLRRAEPSRAVPCRPAVGGPCRAALRYKAAPQQRWPRDAMCVPRCFFLPLLLFLLLLPLLAAPSPAVAPSGRPRARRGLTYPGTLWCGAGSNADSYEQLGKELCPHPMVRPPPPVLLRSPAQNRGPISTPIPSFVPVHSSLCYPIPHVLLLSQPSPERSPYCCCPTRSVPSPYSALGPVSILVLISDRSQPNPLYPDQQSGADPAPVPILLPALIHPNLIPVPFLVQF